MTFVPNFIFLFNYDIIITIILSLLFYYTLFVNHIEKPVCEFMIKVCMYVSCQEEAFCEPFIYLFIYLFNNFASQAGRAPQTQQLTPITVGPFTLPTLMTMEDS